MTTMRRLIDLLRCPTCLGRVIVPDRPFRTPPEDLCDVTYEPWIEDDYTGDIGCVECGAVFDVRNGIPDMTAPYMDNPKDEHWSKDYEVKAARYDQVISAMQHWLGVDYEWEQRRLIDRLELRPGMKVLEVSVGTGRNMMDVLPRLGGGGWLVGLDLTSAMLEQARNKAAVTAADSTVHFVRGNGSYLPFAAGDFDAVLHVGAINTYGRKGRALAEVLRVARPGAVILVGDEGLPEGERADSWYQRMAETNSLYRQRPPLDLLPFSEVTDFHLFWGIRRLYYAMVFRKR